MFYQGPEYLNQNSLRAFPLMEGTTRRDLTGNFAIPDDFIVAASFCVSSDAATRVFISRVSHSVSQVKLFFADQSSVVIGEVVITKSTHTQGKVYYLSSYGLYTGATGKVVINSVTSIGKQLFGDFNFSLSGSEIETILVLPAFKGVEAIIFTDNTGIEYTTSGAVTIRARSNARWQMTEANQVYLDASDLAGFNKPCLTQTAVKTINHTPPDENGNFSIVGAACATVTAATATITITDSCCTPCSDCDNLAELTRRTVMLENNFLELKNLHNSINSQLTSYLITANSSCSCD